jgi:transcriptional regulator with XRE-family HTH domain
MSGTNTDRAANRMQQRVALNVFAFREHHGLSQDQLAQLAGIDRKTVNRIENGHFSPSIDTLTRLSVALGIEISKLLK